MKRKAPMIVRALTAGILSLSLLIPCVAQAAIQEHSYLSAEGKYYSDYDSIEEVFEAAKQLNGEIVAEGALLLKNDGTLPLNPKQDRISIFGIMSNSLKEGVNGAVIQPNAVETTGNAFRNAGFQVNDTLEAFYAAIPDSQKDEGQEPDVALFAGKVERSFQSFDDAAVIIIQRVDCQEDKDFSVALTGNTTNAAGDYDNLETGNYAGNKENDGPRELQDKVDPEAEDGAPYSWAHEHSALAPAHEGEEADENGNVEVKHGLQLTKSEIELIDYVKERFDKVIVMFNSSTVFEAYNLEKDPGISGIIWFGRPGIQETGITAVAKIVSGEINPSGGASAEWMRDFTADPTWQNAGNNRQFRYIDGYAGNTSVRYENGLYTYSPSTAGRTGLNGIRSVENEEGIYLGYKYYETVYYELLQGNLQYEKTNHKLVPADYALAEGEAFGTAEEWHDYNVVYPFGFGLSYTDFTFEMGGIYLDEALKQPIAGEEVDASLFASEEGSPAEVKSIYIPVKVTNVGGMAGKQAVEIYATAPYTYGGIEKAFVKLVGFEKTKILLPGKSQTVVVKVDTQDLASFDYNDANGDGETGWVMDEGEYILRAMSCSSMLVSQRMNNYDEASFTLGAKALMKLDNGSDNLAMTLFSDPETRTYSIREGGDALGQVNVNPEASMTIMSRGDMLGTFPEALTVDDLTFKNSVIEYEKDCINRANQIFKEGDDVDAETNPWYIPDSEFEGDGAYANWTQVTEAEAALRENGLCKVLLPQMAGVPLDGYILVDGEEFTWDDFMNQLTLTEIKSMITGNGTPEIKSVAKAKSTNADRPLNLGSTFTWADEPLQAATFNKDLIHRQGQIVGEFGLQKTDNNGNSYGQLSGWWGPGSDTNRSPFSGRTKEYYSQDSILAGYIGAAAVKGAQEKGVNVYIKHFAFHDQEATHAGSSVWMDEQTMRENYLASFKRIFQEGEPSAVMFACWRIGIEQIANNYPFMTQLLRDEWGWDGENASDMVMGQRSTAWENPQAPVDEEGNRVTDYDWPVGNFNNTEMMLRAGLGLPMSGTAPKGIWISSGRDGMGTVAFGTIPEFSNTASYKTGDIVSITTREGTGRNAVVVAVDYYKFTMDHEPGDFNAEETVTTTSDDPALLDMLGESRQQYYFLRKAALNGFYQATNSKIIENGVATRLFVDKAVELKQGEEASVLSDLTEEGLNGGDAVYSVVSGALPAGLSLNAATGEITGVPTAIADGAQVRIGVTVDRWVKKQATYTFQIASAWTAALPGAKAGEAYEGSVEALIEGGEGAVEYSVVSGALPAGLELNAETGAITGTPAEAGEYTFVLGYSRGGAQYTSEEYTLTVE
ncbi:MAG: putative Ig domain-containing protein [Lachnospiraceae bacterium]|nr:putative Ig domain-containing protein [Lachnospiraceae bacterium]